MYEKAAEAVIRNAMGDGFVPGPGEIERVARIISKPIAPEVERKNDLLKEAREALQQLAPRVKDYDGCFARMVGGRDGPDECNCTSCKIRREIGG